ncbi:MAG: histidine kinase, partial [Candidatus Dormibacteraceae bacterium]
MTTLPDPAAGPPGGARGRFKIYLGGAPGSGKTFAVLGEGNRLREQGRDVVAAFVEAYGRPRTVQAVGQLEILPRTRIPYGGTVQEEMDLERALRRHPQVALADELAHTNVPGVGNEKRWQDVETLLEAGIDVLTTVNVQHVEGVKDLVERITGIRVRETVPDRLLDEADDLQFVDITPEALRKRMRHGNIYPRERVEPALGNFFSATNLTALRELGLRVVADSMAQRSGVVESGEDVLVVLLGEDRNERLVRRSARLARHLRGLSMVVAVVGPEGDDGWSAAAARTADQVGSACTVLRTADVTREAIRAVEQVGARVVIVDWRARQRPASPVGRSLAMRLVDAVPDVDLLLAASRLAPDREAAPTSTPQRPLAEDLLRRMD